MQNETLKQEAERKFKRFLNKRMNEIMKTRKQDTGIAEVTGLEVLAIKDEFLKLNPKFLPLFDNV
jgi:hypothetical protein